VILVFSVRREGKSLAEIARTELGKGAGSACAVAILFIILIALAGLGFVIVNALAESSWGTFTIAASIPIAMLMGVYIFAWNKGSHRSVQIATWVGVTALLAAVIFGKWVPEIPALHQLFLLDRKGIIIAMAIYGFAASVLPVWLLLTPRDYLSSYMKIGTILLIVAGIMIVNPKIEFPLFTNYIHGGGPIIPGSVWPFCCITIMCGAISGFHALVSSGTTPKMLSNELHARPIGYGAMLTEAVVSIVCLIAACSLKPGDYYAINVPPSVFAGLGIPVQNLDALTQAIGEQSLWGRTGGAVSLAVGIAHIFGSYPLLAGLMKYLYHFIIMFEALFILTTVDAGTRIARFILQELLGNFYSPLKKTNWMPGSIFTSLLVVLAWGFLIWNASINTIWPMFGIANQLLAAIALAIGTAILVRSGKGKYAWTTAVPGLFVAITTLTAAYQMIANHYWPKSATTFMIHFNITLIAIMVFCSLVIFGSVLQKIFRQVKPEPLKKTEIPTYPPQAPDIGD